MNKLNVSQQVNIVGKYLYNHIDSAFKYKKSGNTFDVYMVVFYQLPKEKQDWTKPDEYNDMHEIVINLNLTTYDNKVRLNILEVDPNEKTLGYATYSPESLSDLKKAEDTILRNVKFRLSRAYREYEFIF